MLTIPGAGLTVKTWVLVFTPFGLTRVMAPVVAPVGTLVVIFLSELTVKEELVLLNFTTVTPVKADPLIMTLSPTFPDAGAREVMLGRVFDVAEPTVMTALALLTAP